MEDKKENMRYKLPKTLNLTPNNTIMKNEYFIMVGTCLSCPNHELLTILLVSCFYSKKLIQVLFAWYNFMSTQDYKKINPCK